MKFFGKEYDINTKHFTYYIFGLKISKKDKLGILRAENEYLTNVINTALGAKNMPKAKGEVREWQLELLELLKEFDKICRANNLKYWLDFGMFLGAIRHKGLDYCFAEPVWVYSYDTIFPLKNLEFEGQKYYCPNNVEAYLSDKYNGNYMNFPKYINNVTNGEIVYLKG